MSAKRNHNHWIIAIVFIVFFLGACSPATPPSAVPFNPAQGMAQDAPTLTLSPIGTLSANQTPSTVAQGAPAQTSTLLPTPTRLPTITLTPTPTTEIRLLNIKDGDSIAAMLDKVGVPLITIQAEIIETKYARRYIRLYLLMDGQRVDERYVPDQAGPGSVELKWWPHRTGVANLVVGAELVGIPTRDLGSKQLTINVIAVPPTPMKQRMIDLFKDKFGLVMTSPALARFGGDNIDAARWVSAAYVGNMIYVIYVYDDGRVETEVRPINDRTVSFTRCRPAGRYRLLVVFVDYHNTDITKDAALASLKKAAAETNALYAEYATRHKLAAPILQLDVTGAYISASWSPGQLITAEQVKALTGFDPAQFDLLEEMDLDAKNAYGSKDPSRTFNGIALGGCSGSGANRVNVWMYIGSVANMDLNLSWGALKHELAHDMGWQHWWPCGDGSSLQARVQPFCNPLPPALLWGWEDLDGDNIPEILDPTPYGITQIPKR